MKKGFLLIDGCRNAVILDKEEIKASGLDELLMKNGIMATVKRNANMKELDSCVRKYLKGGWDDVEGGEG